MWRFLTRATSNILPSLHAGANTAQGQRSTKDCTAALTQLVAGACTTATSTMCPSQCKEQLATEVDKGISQDCYAELVAVYEQAGGTESRLLVR